MHTQFQNGMMIVNLEFLSTGEFIPCRLLHRIHGNWGEVDSKEWFADNPYAEWYYNSLNIGKGPTYKHHIEKYGKDFKYEDFIPMWKAENWDPKQWAEIFKEAGAEYVVLTTKHHDGFCLFPSKYTHFNSVEMGPKRISPVS